MGQFFRCGTFNTGMKFLAILLFIFLFTNLVYAEIEIYCPECKKHIYTYIEDEIPKGAHVKAKDFKPANEDIAQPIESDSMVCPYCGIVFEGYDYSCWKHNLAIPTKYYPAYTFLTKDEGDFYWTPYNIKP